jgi:hypothetical protein
MTRPAKTLAFARYRPLEQRRTSGGNNGFCDFLQRSRCCQAWSDELMFQGRRNAISGWTFCNLIYRVILRWSSAAPAPSKAANRAGSQFPNTTRSDLRAGNVEGGDLAIDARSCAPEMTTPINRIPKIGSRITHPVL